MDKKPSFIWALLIGLLFPVLQTLIFFARFQRLNADASLIDYVYFFVTGVLIGVALIYFLRRSQTKSMYRGAVTGFIIGIPLALFGMLFGGLLGFFGVILSSSPAIFTTAIGYFIGRAFAKE